MASLLFFMAIQSFLCFSTATSLTAFTLPLIPRFSPESPFYRENLTEEQIAQDLIRQSEARQIYLDSESEPSLNNIRLTVNYNHFLYVTKLSFGTPAKTQVLVLDTGSGVTWTQCEPCVTCFNQTTPIFDPSRSSSYRRQPCDSSCLPPFYRCVGGLCHYGIKYTGGASSSGIVSKETFHFEKAGGGTLHFPDMIFGCGHDNKNVPFRGKETSGLIGLNNFRHSLVQQLFPSIQGRFSYCLISGFNRSSRLKFGQDAVIPPGHDVQTLRFVSQSFSPNIYLDLVDISVGYERLHFAPGTFTIRRDGKGGCFIDNGAAFSVLDDGPYHIVMDALHRYYTSQGHERVHSPSSGYEYCYKIKPDFRHYLRMMFHFNGSVDYLVKAANTFKRFDQSGYFCLMFRPGRGRNVLGAWQQQNVRISFDLRNKVLQFKLEDCARDVL